MSLSIGTLVEWATIVAAPLTLVGLLWAIWSWRHSRRQRVKVDLHHHSRVSMQSKSPAFEGDHPFQSEAHRGLIVAVTNQNEYEITVSTVALVLPFHPTAILAGFGWAPNRQTERETKGTFHAVELATWSPDTGLRPTTDRLAPDVFDNPPPTQIGPRGRAAYWFDLHQLPHDLHNVSVHAEIQLADGMSFHSKPLRRMPKNWDDHGLEMFGLDESGDVQQRLQPRPPDEAMRASLADLRERHREFLAKDEIRTDALDNMARGVFTAMEAGYTPLFVAQDLQLSTRSVEQLAARGEDIWCEPKVTRVQGDAGARESGEFTAALQLLGEVHEVWTFAEELDALLASSRDPMDFPNPALRATENGVPIHVPRLMLRSEDGRELWVDNCSAGSDGPESANSAAVLRMAGFPAHSIRRLFEAQIVHLIRGKETPLLAEPTSWTPHGMAAEHIQLVRRYPTVFCDGTVVTWHEWLAILEAWARSQVTPSWAAAPRVARYYWECPPTAPNVIIEQGLFQIRLRIETDRGGPGDWPGAEVIRVLQEFGLPIEGQARTTVRQVAWEKEQQIPLHNDSH